jgi:hypothetical protein
MATWEPRKTVRLIAASANNHTQDTVNVRTAKDAVNNQFPEYLQATAAQAAAAPKNTIPTLQDSGSTNNPLFKTIFITGYAGPN